MGWKEPDNKDRDPWDGHSDLDEFLAQLKRRFEQRFGGGKSGPLRPRIWWLVVGILIAIWLLSGVYEVAGGKQAVLLRFGAYVGTADTGMHWHWPWPITTKQVVDVKEKRSVTRNATLATKDHQLVTAGLTVSYRISRPFRYLYASDSPTEVLNAWIDSVLVNLVRTHTQAQLKVLHANPGKLDVGKADMRRIATLDPGIEVEGVKLSRLEPPEAVSAAESTALKQRKQSASATASAEAAARASITAAQNKATTIVTQARKEAQTREDAARTEVARFKALVPAWRRHPHVTEMYLRNEAIREALTAAPKIVVSGSVHAVTLPASALTSSKAPAVATGPEAKPAGGRKSGGKPRGALRQ